ncbi:hypothetical protein D3C84_1161340 [compost metagenome]
MGIDDQPGDFIGFVGDQCFLQEVAQRRVGQRHLRGHPLAIVERGDAGQEISGARRTGLGQHFLEVVEAVSLGADGMGECGHGAVSSCYVQVFNSRPRAP